MKVKAQRVSQRKDGETWCSPSQGYKEDPIEIDLASYVEIAASPDPLPESDKYWPEGAPFPDVFRYGNKILRKKATP